MIEAVLLDIEGTVGDIRFVRDVLFPYARERLEARLIHDWLKPEMEEIVAAARTLSGEALSTPAAAADTFRRWMDEDKKIGPLKTLQGILWREGYTCGALKAHLYDDAIEAMYLWRQKGLRLCIYSSGSVEAQKLYFAHSIAGDLTSLIDGFFDTATGPKTESASYSIIAGILGHSPANVYFLSDAPAEIAAARTAGLGASRIDRTLPPGQPHLEADGRTHLYASFSDMASLY